MLPEIIDGYRRTAVKTRHRSLMNDRVEEFEERGYKTMVKEHGGYLHLYTKRDLPPIGKKEPHGKEKS